LKTLFSHGINHPNGWGMAIFSDAAVSLEKEPVCSNNSRYLRERIKDPMMVSNMFAHIRYATKGKEDYLNCHPFVKKDSSGRTWTLMHNGTIFECPETDVFFEKQRGSTDSERILLYLIDRVDLKIKELGRELTDRERFDILDGIIHTITYPNNKVNIMIYDGDLVYVHTNLPNTLHYKQLSDSVIFSTEPLDDQGWEQVTLFTLLAYRNGRLVFSGTKHGNEYHLKYEDIRYLYLDHSFL